MKNILKFRIILFSLVLFLMGTLPALADDDFDPFNPDNPDPGNASIDHVFPFVLIATLFIGYYFLRLRTKQTSLSD